MRRQGVFVVIVLVVLTVLTGVLILPRPAQGRSAVSARQSDTLPLPHDFSSHVTTVNGIHYHYIIGGVGMPLVLLHGWPETWYEWRKTLPVLAQHYRVIVPDLRGAGDSAAPSCCYDKKTLANDVYRLIHQLGYAKISLVGHDIGGMVAYAYAAAHPNEVRRLIILEAPIPDASLYQFPVLSAPGSPTGIASGKQGISGAWQFGFHVIPELPEELVSGKVRVYLSWFYRNYSFVQTAFTNTDINEYVRHYAVPASLHAGFEYYRALFQDIADNKGYEQKKLPMPVLALGGDHGAKDTVFKQMQGLATHVQGGVLANCGHWMPEEQPNTLTTQMLTFLQ